MQCTDIYNSRDQTQKKGQFQIDNFEIFESIRKNKEKGGTLLGVHKSLEPVLIEEYSETFELLVAEIKTTNQSIRIITGYGPQENWKLDEKMPFFYCSRRGGI